MKRITQARARNLCGENGVLRQQLRESLDREEAIKKLGDDALRGSRQSTQISSAEAERLRNVVADLTSCLRKEQDEHRESRRHGNQLVMERDAKLTALEAQQGRDAKLINELVAMLRKG